MTQQTRVRRKEHPLPPHSESPIVPVNHSSEEEGQNGTENSNQASKTNSLLRLLRRKRGATLGELQEVSGWQAHSVRGFLSGTVKKRLGLSLSSEKSGAGPRRYVVAKG